MLHVLLLELLYKALALAVTVWAAHHLASIYLEALVDFSRAYLTLLELLYADERSPLRV